MKLNRRHMLALSAAALSLTIFATGVCTPSAAQEPKKGGTLVFALPGDPQHLNLAISTNTTAQQAATHLFSTLVRVNNKGEVEGDLAESWEKSEDGLTYTFHLHKNMKWHDGKPLTAHDVHWALTEINQKYNPLASTAFAAVKSIEAPDDSTLVFKLSRPFPPFLPYSFVAQWIYPRHLYEGTDPTTNEHNFKNPVGSGPFMLKEWVKGSHLIYERNPYYYKKGMPYLDRLVGRIIPDGAARVIALEQGEVDYLSMYALPSSAVPQLQKIGELNVVLDRNRINHGTIMAHINLRHPVLKVKEVRQALYYAIDRKLIVERAMNGLADIGSSPISSHQTQWYNPAVKDRYPFDPAKAEALLDQAGLKKGADGKRFSIRLTYGGTNEGGALQAAAEIMREQLKAIGVELILEPRDYPTWMQTVHTKWDFDLSMGSYQTGPDPAIGVSRLYICKNIQKLIGRNLMGYCNEDVDKLFAQAEGELDPAKRRDLYHKVQEIIVEEVPALWLWDKPSPVAFGAKVHGNIPPGGTHQENFDGVWIDN